jgi:hypothetical protein
MNIGHTQAATVGVMPPLTSRFPNDSGGVDWDALGGVSINTANTALLLARKKSAPQTPQNSRNAPENFSFTALLLHGKQSIASTLST